MKNLVRYEDLIFPLVNIKQLCTRIKRRVRSDNDIVIALTGDEGVSKSSLGLILSLLLDKNFNFTDNMIYTDDKNEIINKTKALKPGSVVNFDEIGKQLEKQDWAKEFPKFMKHLFRVNRGRNLIYIFILPRLIDLTEYFRKHRVFMEIYMDWRGFGSLFVKTRGRNVRDPWYEKLNTFMQETNRDSSEFGTLLLRQRQKGFRGFINFPKVDDRLYNAYKGFKLKYDLLNLAKNNGSVEQEALTDIKKRKLLNVLLNEYKALTKMTYEDMVRDLTSKTGMEINRNLIRYYAQGH